MNDVAGTIINYSLISNLLQLTQPNDWKSGALVEGQMRRVSFEKSR